MEGVLLLIIYRGCWLLVFYFSWFGLLRCIRASRFCFFICLVLKLELYDLMIYERCLSFVFICISGIYSLVTLFILYRQIIEIPHRPGNKMFSILYQQIVHQGQ